ncbi:MAG: hypothetical protein ACI8YQ_002442 [Polaribacter sp.]|jgi:hypothetical protein
MTSGILARSKEVTATAQRERNVFSLSGCLGP